jgi:hypothetical protein
MSFPTFRIVSSTENLTVVEICPRAGAHNLIWMETENYTEEWKEQTKVKILTKDAAPKSPLVIPVSESKDEPYTSDCYESDPEDEKETENEDAEFDSQWMPKVDLTPYEKPNDQWTRISRKKKSAAAPMPEIATDL